MTMDASYSRSLPDNCALSGSGGMVLPQSIIGSVGGGYTRGSSPALSQDYLGSEGVKTTETLKPPNLCLRLRTPYFYPDSLISTAR